MAAPDFDPSDAIASGISPTGRTGTSASCSSGGRASSTWVAGRYSTEEPSVHAFDLMVAERYAGEGFVSQRLVRTAIDSHRRSPTRRNTMSANGTNGSNGNQRDRPQGRRGTNDRPLEGDSLEGLGGAVVLKVILDDRASRSPDATSASGSIRIARTSRAGRLSR